MSKKSFSKEIDDLMYRKVKSLENSYYDDLFKKEEYFELVLCLAYMTLSKEKIIKKDMKDNRRLERLTKMVSTTDIDSLFQSGFCSEMPRIIDAQENDNTWILDNIRDSIMHGVFEIDEEKKCFIIDNDYFDRKLKAEVPFLWFIAYAKNDILSKKILDKYTIRGFYYNVGKKDKKNFVPRAEAKNHILYCVNIEGNKFNVRDVERRVTELFDEYSKREVDEADISKYEERAKSEKFKYNERYLISFYIASEAVKEQIEKEFPGTSVKIHIDNRKARIVNKIEKGSAAAYHSYDLMFDKLNSFLGRKSDVLLQYITNIIENLDKVPHEGFDKLSEVERVNLINMILKGENLQLNTWRDVDYCKEENLKALRAICLNVYGLATLVINHEDLYDDFFLEQSPQAYGILAYSSKPFIDYATTERKLILEVLEKDISIFDDQTALKDCENPKGIEFRTNRLNRLMAEREALVEKIRQLSTEMKFEGYINYDVYNYEEHDKLMSELDLLYEHFNKASTIEGKRAVKKVIGDFLNKKMEFESYYTYGYCHTMEEALTIIRNSFSHIGRMYVGKDYFTNTRLILNDFDTDGKKSGTVVCSYINLIKMLREPLLSDEYTDQSKK